ncbi:MAG TPA: hypothetical protein VGH73_20150 [Thermoanaerobaculia bacterium]|jgi:hypothetical protein
MTSLIVCRRFSFPVLSLLLLLPLAGCGQGAGRDTTTTATGSGHANARPKGPQAHLTLAGALTFDADVPMTCDTFPEKGLVFIFGQAGTKTPQTEVRIGSFAADGEYPANVAIHDQPGAGDVRSWTGTAQIKLDSHVIGGLRKRTAFNGTFTGTYQGNTGGTGTLNGRFQGCAVRGVSR